jgi:hypothetical protein
MMAKGTDQFLSLSRYRAIVIDWLIAKHMQVFVIRRLIEIIEK